MMVAAFRVSLCEEKLKLLFRMNIVQEDRMYIFKLIYQTSFRSFSSQVDICKEAYLEILVAVNVTVN